MLIEYRLALINDHMTEASIERCYAAPGDALASGAKLLDLRVDLGHAFAQDCPPISFYRIVMRERAYLRRIGGVRETCRVGATIALFSTEPDEPIAGTAARAVRVATAGIAPPASPAGSA